MSQRAESFVREFETAGRVFFELGNSAADAYDDAALSLFDFVSGGAGLSHVEAQKIYTLLESYEVKRDAAAEAEVRKAEAVRLFLVEFRHLYPA